MHQNENCDDDKGVIHKTCRCMTWHWMVIVCYHTECQEAIEARFLGELISPKVSNQHVTHLDQFEADFQVDSVEKQHWSWAKTGSKSLVHVPNSGRIKCIHGSNRWLFLTWKHRLMVRLLGIKLTWSLKTLPMRRILLLLHVQPRTHNCCTGCT